jgi:hypothetical protein
VVELGRRSANAPRPAHETTIAPAPCHEIMTSMALSTATAQLPASAEHDIAYVTASYEPISDRIRPLVEQGLLPRATYVLPDGTPMVPADHAQLLEDAGGNPAAVAAHFCKRFLAAGGDPADAPDEYEAWLSGGYGACLARRRPKRSWPNHR